jgi:hypothetical protein
MRETTVGDRVRVPWGLGSTEGVVRGIHGPRRHAFALVVLRGPGESDDDAPTVSVPVMDLEPVGKGRKTAR